MLRNKLQEIYKLLLDAYGPQNWWPGESPFEVAVGAILTQNTNWQNVEKAINNLKNADLLDAKKLHELELEQIAELIKPAGYFNIKAKRLKNFLNWLIDNYHGDLGVVEKLNKYRLREELLSIKGVGPETADSILLYAFNKTSFVVDSYTFRIMGRHEVIDEFYDYHQLQDLFESNLPEDLQLFNEYHALLVRVAKEHCKKKPNCSGCPLEKLPHTIETKEW